MNDWRKPEPLKLVNVRQISNRGGAGSTHTAAGIEDQLFNSMYSER